MRALALADDRDAALELFGRFRQRLADDLGADPEPATLALADRLASRGERPQGNGGRGSRPAEGATHRHAGAAPAPLVGREAELASLLAAWSDVRGGEGARAAIIVGDPGTGRTRLLEELVARATLDGGGVTLARAVPADRSLEGAGLLAIARGGLATMPGVGAAAPEAHAALRERLPEWRERFPGPLGTDTSVGAAVTELVRAAAEDRAVLVALDDAQWIDEASLRALLALLRDIPRARLMLAATMTNGAISPALDELRSRIGRGTAGVTVTLRALGPAQVRALAGAWLPRYDDGALDRIVRRVVADSAGLPLLAVELLRAVAHGLELDESSEPWPAPAQTLDQTLPGDMPDSLSAAVRLASSRLGEDPRRVLAAASAGTGRVTLDALAEAAALPRDRVAAALDELEWTRWLVWDARGYTFTARVVREIVARDLLTPGQRRRLGEVLRAAAAEGG
jgi:hypothetical protein